MQIINKSAYHNISHLPNRRIKYLVIHYTAGVSSRQGTAIGTAGYFGSTPNEASADYIVDDRDMVQYNPDPRNYWTWAVGGSKWNNKGGRLYGIANNQNSISIEVCSSYKGKVPKQLWPNDPNFYFTDATLKNAEALAKHLMKEFNVPVENVIRHYDVNGKTCPGIVGWNADSGSEAAWFAFKKRLGEAQSDKLYRVQTGAYKNKEYAENLMKKVKGAGFDAIIKKIGGLYKVQVGAYRNKANAKRELDRLSKAGFAGFTFYGTEPVFKKIFIKNCSTISFEPYLGITPWILNFIKIGIFFTNIHTTYV